MKVPAVTTSALPHNDTKTQGSCPQQSGEALELSQGWLEAVLPSHRWIRWEIATSGHTKHREGNQEFCESPLSAAKQRRLSHVNVGRPMCHAGTKSASETLYRFFIRAPVGTDSDRAASPLLCQLQQKKQERWEAAVNSIDFSHFNRKAWRTINKLTGRYGRFSCPCPISANSIASQLVKNGTHRTKDRESTRLVKKELSDLWKIPTHEGHSISEPFKPDELAAALVHLKPGKYPGLDSIFREFILHAGSALKSWFCDFLSSCMRQLKIPTIWRRALVVAIPKPEKSAGA